MNDIMTIPRHLPARQGFPLRLFAAAFAISLVITVFCGWQSWQLYDDYEAMSRKHIALTERVGRIMLLDEVLTMSARMAAATGDFDYERRYDEFDPQLTKEIDAVRAILPRAEIAKFVGETDDANLALVKLERQAFALSHRGKRQEAMALLTGADYMRWKGKYADGMARTVGAANQLIEKDVQHLDTLSRWVAAVSAVGSLLLLATWYFAIRSARSWAAERREAEDALRKAQDELVRREKLAVLGQVAGSVGHELRNPLGVMSNAVYFLQTVLVDADAITREYLGIIKDEIAGAERIVSDLLDSVRTKPPQPEMVGVKALVDRALRKCGVPSGVEVRLAIPEALPPLWVDPLQVHQVLRNLIANGIDAMAAGGTLEIRASADAQDRTVALSIRDTGCGMTPEQLDRLFQPLFTTKARGIGLGLVVVKNLTEANGGRVEVRSEAGKGSTFAVTLPIAAAGAEQAP